MTRGSVAAKVRSYKELHPSEYCSAPGCLWRITDREGNTISICRKHGEPMLKFRVIVQPNEGEGVSYLVGGFDAKDALTQGKHRWVGSAEGRSLDDIRHCYAMSANDEKVPA